MKYFKSFMQNLLVALGGTLLIILFVACMGFILTGAVLILVAFLKPSTIRTVGMWRFIGFMVIYFLSLALFTTINDFIEWW